LVIGVAFNTICPPLAVILAVPEQVAAIPTVLEQVTPETLGIAVPKDAEPLTVPLPAVPLVGVTDTVIVWVPALEGLYLLTVIRLQLAPAASVWPGRQAPLLAGAYVK